MRTSTIYSSSQDSTRRLKVTLNVNSLGSSAKTAARHIRDHKWWYAAAAAICVTYIVVVGVWWDASSRFAQWIHLTVWEQWLFPNKWNVWLSSPLFQWLLVLALLLVIFKVKPRRDSEGWDAGYRNRVTIPGTSDTGKRNIRTAHRVAWVLAPLVFVNSLWGAWTNITGEGASFSGKTIIVVEDLDRLPSTLADLTGSLRKSTDPRCDLEATNNGVSVCVKQGSANLEWVNRNVSAEGASVVIGRTAANDNGANLLTDSITAIHKGSSQMWSGVIDGKNAQPVRGVAEWTGKYGDAPNTCQFSGNYALGKAFAGQWRTNLADYIASQYPNLRFDFGDLWGYCKGDDYASAEPIIVIPMQRQEGYGYRTTMRFAGLLVIKGSPTGEPKMALDTTVAEGTYPGPVYPASLAASQREGINWASGFADHQFKSFGYEPTKVETNAGNRSEHQLISAADGKSYWVTPLSPNGSGTQSTLAYSVVPADTATVGELNTMRVYVLDGDNHDPRVANLQAMEQQVISAVNRTEPSFTNSKGTIKEFLPVKEDLWQVYAERGGYVMYKIEVRTNGQVVSVTPLEQQTTDAGISQACSKPIGQMSNAELTACAKAIADESARRMK